MNHVALLKSPLRPACPVAMTGRPPLSQGCGIAGRRYSKREIKANYRRPGNAELTQANSSFS
jgi:hypothetical protein